MEVKETLETYRDVTPDPPHSEIPSLPRDVTYALNRQTAFNRSMLGASRECGCFHCGRRFPTSLVTGWLEEPGEDDTGLCPYCGTDALVVGDAERLLSTALLAMLYEEWFGEERDERRKAANDAPGFAGYDDYLRRGVPFRWRYVPGRRQVGEVGVFSIGVLRGPQEWDEKGFPLHVMGVLDDSEPGGVWHLAVDAEGDEEHEFLLVGEDGRAIPFSP